MSPEGGTLIPYFINVGKFFGNSGAEQFLNVWCKDFKKQQLRGQRQPAPTDFRPSNLVSGFTSIDI